MKKRNRRILTIQKGKDIYIYRCDAGQEEHLYRAILEHGMNISLNISLQDAIHLTRQLEKMVPADKFGTIKMIDGKVSFKEGDF